MFVRLAGLRHAEWADFDFGKALWIIPPHKTKMRRAHNIPLSRQALALVATIEHDADYSRFLFPSLRSVDRPMSENTINAALRRMGLAHDEMTDHGFRAMAATLLDEMGLWHPTRTSGSLPVATTTPCVAHTRGTNMGTSGSA